MEAKADNSCHAAVRFSSGGCGEDGDFVLGEDDFLGAAFASDEDADTLEQLGG